MGCGSSTAGGAAQQDDTDPLLTEPSAQPPRQALATLSRVSEGEQKPLRRYLRSGALAAQPHRAATRLSRVEHGCIVVVSVHGFAAIARQGVTTQRRVVAATARPCALAWGKAAIVAIRTNTL